MLFSSTVAVQSRLVGPGIVAVIENVCVDVDPQSDEFGAEKGEPEVPVQLVLLLSAGTTGV
jgi:hypothetical protein